MISCTEFIPAYSTLFTYLEEKYGPDEVPTYWDKHFDPKRAPVYQFVSKEGIHGCWSYWTGTLNEEAADFTMYLNEKRGFFYNVMHWCPSKGRLLKLKEEVGAEPYHGYCLHCDYYRKSVEACGLKYIYNFNGTEKAACSMLIYDPNIFDGRVIIDEDTLIMDRKAADNEYFHKAFHNSLNKGISYLAETYGEGDVREYMAKFTKDFYWKVAEKAKEQGLAAIEEKILDTYKKEHAEDAVQTVISGDTLTVTVSACPALAYFRSVGTQVSPLYYLSTEAVMQTLADMSGLTFRMDAYDQETGAATYRFIKK